ncbi:MAG: phytanoyl-CoA dioxygenase family protein [Gemmatimonadota bacterium]|nr:phytanoyl-CoA dioxygenase family protein [Gemmatimonadota bacterium]
MSLTKQEVKHFKEEGYLVKSGIYSQADMLPLKNAINGIVESESRRMKEEGMVENIYEREGFETRLACIYEDNAKAGRSICHAVMGKGGGGFSGPGIFEMIRHPGLVSCISSLVGPDVVGSSVYRIRTKMPHYNHGEVPWHQDSGYFLAHCDRFMIVTCWIPLVDTTIKNGCLYVLPRAHKNGILRHYTGGHAGFLEIVDEDLPARDPVPIEMEAGGALFLTNLTPHSSYTNSSNQVRWSIDLRYQGKEAPNNVDEPPETYTPERDAVTMACYPPEADFVIKDKEHPENQVETAEHFRQVRERYEKARPFMPGRGWTQMERKK